MRDWQIKRRERTRQLIELGGLVVKARLVDLTDDDRAMLYGAFLWMADKLRSDDGAHAAALWRKRGARAFESDAAAAAPRDAERR
ncbi:conjugal transfer protein TraD [Sphingopyxis granuli]|uniref:conjugal transfer protein TraD n=1 Tax=Sphingopyxis granuli TaxID=267128 RepID=UPI001F52E4B9|nr:conjugal transfer protein TraD [Sphingopyxis granuli]UNK79199.1 conjugal transfer protein TraD [Sphingopyxis granuli]